MTPNDFEGLSQQDAKILYLDAMLILARCEHHAFQAVVRKALYDKGITLDTDTIVQERDILLQKCLAALSDQDAGHASRISRILDRLKNQNS